MPKKKQTSNAMTVEKNSANVLTIRFPEVCDGWEHWFLLSSDRHHDSADCNRELELEHLEMVKQRNGHVLDFGDIFDVMQGKYDPRRSYPEMRPEYLKAMIKDKIGYFDVVVRDLANFYKPYADRFLLIAQGNHEASVKNHNDSDLIEALVSRMNIDNGAQVNKGAYGGWVRFNFTISKTRRESINLKYFHGSGGADP